MKQKPGETVVYHALYLLFYEYYERTRLSRKGWSVDENKNVDFYYSLQMQKKATYMEDFIRDLWGNKCQYLLTGVLIYLMKLDPYFSPKFNGYEQFFIKIYRHRKILSRIGSGNHKVIFPFKNFIKENKKLVLIRC